MDVETPTAGTAVATSDGNILTVAPTRCGSTGYFWNEIIALIDNLLRSYYAIYEFTDDPNCILRIGRDVATEGIRLSDGTEIKVGDPIGTLHLWNEQLPGYNASAGPELG